MRSHNSDSRGIGGDRGLSNSRSIISHARAGKGSNLFDNEASNCGLDRQAHSEHELLLVADWHDRELRGLSPIGKPPTPKRGAWFGLFLASCGGLDLEFKRPRALWATLSCLKAPLRRGAFFVGHSGPGRHEGSACSVDEMDSGAGGTPQRDVHAVVRHIVRKPNLNVLTGSGASVEHVGHAWG